MTDHDSCVAAKAEAFLYRRALEDLVAASTAYIYSPLCFATQKDADKWLDTLRAARKALGAE